MCLFADRFDRKADESNKIRYSISTLKLTDQIIYKVGDDEANTETNVINKVGHSLSARFFF